MVEKAINYPVSVRNNIDTVNKSDKSQAYNKTVDTLKRKKTDTVRTIDKSSILKELTLLTQYINQGIFQYKNYPIEVPEYQKPTEIDIVRYNKHISDLSLQGYDLASITQDIILIPHKNKSKQL